eukprot:scaffold121475_cov36-Phaeocystis_antarctica.AAC.2
MGLQPLAHRLQPPPRKVAASAAWVCGARDHKGVAVAAERVLEQPREDGVAVGHVRWLAACPRQGSNV